MKISEIKVGGEYCTDRRMYGGRRVRVTEVVTNPERTYSGYGTPGTRQVRKLKVEELDPRTGEVMPATDHEDWERRRHSTLTGKIMPARELDGPWDFYADDVLDGIRRTELAGRIGDALAVKLGVRIKVNVTRSYGSQPSRVELSTDVAPFLAFLAEAGIEVEVDP